MTIKEEQILNLISEKKSGVYVLNTKQELKEFYLQGLKKYKQWKAIASIEDWLPVDRDFLQDFRRKLDDAKIDTKIIVKKGGLAYEPKGLKYRKVKEIDSDHYHFSSSIDILDDTLLIMNPNFHVLGVVIEMKLFLDIFNETFNLLWDTLPETK